LFGLLTLSWVCLGEAEAKKDSTIAEALAEEQRMQAKLVNDTEIARAKRDYELNKAKYDTEVFFRTITTFNQCYRTIRFLSCSVFWPIGRPDTIFISLEIVDQISPESISIQLIDKI
jgi:hypothetical protein